MNGDTNTHRRECAPQALRDVKRLTRKVYAIESHEQALYIWRDSKVRNAKLLHVDFHCDQRGLLVNRKKQRAYKIWTRYQAVDEGNFLKQAVIEGIISGIRWVHDEPGGRKDDIKSVKYENDPSAMVHRVALALRQDPGIPIQYEVIPTADWSGIKPDEILDIDWDYFAAVEYPVESVQGRIDSFLSRKFETIPEQTIVCYSPEYSHPTSKQFESFVNELAIRFDAEVVTLPRPARNPNRSRLKSKLKRLYQPARKFYHSANLALRKRGIF